MAKKYAQMIILFSLVWLVYGCTDVPTGTPPTAIGQVNTDPAFRPTSLPTVSLSITPIRTVSAEISPTPLSKPSLSPTPPEPTSDLSTPSAVVTIVSTRTPVSPEKCPAVNPSLVAPFTLEGVDRYLHIKSQFLDFLNSGGSSLEAIAAYRKQNSWANDAVIQLKDVTGDGVPDLLVTEEDGRILMFHCKEGQYQAESASHQTYHYYQPFLIAIKDLNANGINEIIDMAGDDRVRIVTVQEWNGSKFSILNWDFDTVNDVCSDMYGPSQVELWDTDGNGTLELILKQAIPIWSEYLDGLPWRRETRTCSWNGDGFALTNSELAPPEYRFQAVQDADQAALECQYEQALALYQQAIFDDKLEWWSQERRSYEIEAYRRSLNPEEIATTLETPVPDTKEYAYLASYARFRILVLHTLLGYEAEAKIVYDTLQAKFPDGQPGHEFAEMAARFWKAYQFVHDIGPACTKAQEFAAANPSILTFLGSGIHGWQSHMYVPEDVCPFKAMQ